MAINSTMRIDPAIMDQVLSIDTGYNADRMAEDKRGGRQGLMAAAGDAARDFPSTWWIEPREWEDWAHKLDATRGHALNYMDRFTCQGRSNSVGDDTHECTCHSLTSNFEAAWNQAAGLAYDGPKKDFRYPESAKRSVWVSPLSIYAEANPDKWGGANVQQVLEIACKRGFLPDKIQPTNAQFKHTLQGTTGGGNSNQSRGDWVPLSRFPDGWRETAKRLRPLEVIFPKSFEEAVCCLLRGKAVSVGRDGHAVPWAMFMPGQGCAYKDSYNVIRYDSLGKMKSAYQGSFCIATVTAPDDWSNLAA